MKKKKLNVAVIGAGGRMGKEIEQALVQSGDMIPFAGVVRQGSAKGFVHSVNSLKNEFLKQADVWIDFSSVEAFDQNVKHAIALKKPLVSGITGLSATQIKSLTTAGKKIPLLWSPNMSFGIAALKKALSIASELRDFDFQIEELHHRHKKDKPSGTAIHLQKALVANTKTEVPEPVAIRGGGIFGVHKVWMMSEEETLCFEHQALNRRVFATGAIRAARWLAARKTGLYTMDDLFEGTM